MAFSEFHFYSEALGLQATVNVVIPQRRRAGEIGIGGKADSGKYKCLYLLHGLSDDHTIWLRRTSIERYAADYGICVVMPAAEKSFYTDMKYGLKYYTYIAEELPQIMGEFFNVSDKREDNYVAGLSMGGYGALKIALRSCDRFCAGAGLSAVIEMDRRLGNALTLPIFGETGTVPPEDDLYALARRQAGNPNAPRLFMAVGTEDGLYGENVRFRDALNGLHYDLSYHEAPGGHTWDFWDAYIQEVLRWMFR